MGASTPEGKAKSQIKKYLISVGAWSCTPIGSTYMSAGVPDILVCYHGFFIGIEVKAPGKENNTTALQDLQIQRIREAGGIAIVASCVDEVRYIVEYIGDRYAHKAIPEELQSRSRTRVRKAKAGPTRPDEGSL